MTLLVILKMSYQKCEVGDALVKTIDEMIAEGQITSEFAKKIYSQYEESAKKVLKETATTELSFEGKLSGYRLSQDVWTLLLRNVKFQQLPELGIVDKVKIIAYAPVR